LRTLKGAATKEQDDMKKNNSLLIASLVLITTLAACAPVHQVVRVKSIKDEATGERKSFYGVTYNHSLIPEYTKSATGLYANSYDEAYSLMNQKSADLDSWIGNKYYLMNSAWYRLGSSISGLGLLATSVFVIPVEWVGERFFPDPDLGGRRSFRQITKDFFEPTYDEPRLKITSSVSPS
jgi:hypothetical protein